MGRIFLFLLSVVLLGALLYVLWRSPRLRRIGHLSEKPFPPAWRKLLTEHVRYYARLRRPAKRRFERRILLFLDYYKITGVETEITDLDKLLVASSGVIPMFGFDKDWLYPNLEEVLLYAESYNRQFETTGDDRNILGMVGEGHLSNKLTISQSSLHSSFDNRTSKSNPAIHEFIHLIDMQDGSVDGVPENIIDRPYAVPWLKLMHREIDAIHAGDSDINPYGVKSEAEFLAVAGEYFFGRPRLFRKKHPDLYNLLQEIFHQKVSKKGLQPEGKDKSAMSA